mmetsp:Transcript_14290/g.19900  ORF Transcript_14290/g.19900 Transcript_14290/m.19900 type:complete len:145 (+) Transcript_14290:195-629(+)
MTSSIATYLLQNNVMYITGDLNHSYTKLLISILLYANRNKVKKPISIYINGKGSSIVNHLSTYDNLISIHDVINNSKIPIFTHCTGVALNELFIVSSFGLKGYRVALPSSFFALDPFICPGSRYSASDMGLYKSEILRLNFCLV